MSIELTISHLEEAVVQIASHRTALD